jgi:hypothetical protein
VLYLLVIHILNDSTDMNLAMATLRGRGLK